MNGEMLEAPLSGWREEGSRGRMSQCAFLLHLIIMLARKWGVSKSGRRVELKRWRDGKHLPSDVWKWIGRRKEDEVEKARLINIKIHLHGEAAAQRGGEKGSKEGQVGVSLKCSERERAVSKDTIAGGQITAGRGDGTREVIWSKEWRWVSPSHWAQVIKNKSLQTLNP